MKRIVILICILLGIFIYGSAQNLQEVVYLKNGSIIRGTIIEQVPNQSLKIQTSDGSIFAYKMEDVIKITKETNPYIKNNQPTVDGKNNSTSGYRGFVDLGYTFGTFDLDEDRIDFFTTHGYQINQYFFVGGGIGLSYYTSSDYVSLPIYANVHTTFLNKKISPFVDFKVGYSLVDVEGVYMCPSVGCRFATGGNCAINVSGSYVLQRSTGITFSGFGIYYSGSDNIGGLSLRVGYEF